MLLLQSVRILNQYNQSIDSELKSNEDFTEAVGMSFANYVERLWDTELSMGLAIASKNKIWTGLKK